MKKTVLALIVLTLPINLFAARDPLKKVAKNLGKVIKKLESPRVGFLVFPYHDGRMSSGSSIVSERMTMHMANMKGLRVVERNLIKKILEEQRLSESGVIDPSTAKQIGKILGVDVIVTGTLIDLDDKKTEVNARGLLTESGEVVAASRAIIKRSWSDRPKRIVKKPKQQPVRELQEVEKEDDDDLIRIGYPAGGGGRGGGRGRGFGRGWR